MSDTKVLTPDGTQHLIDKIKSEKESIFRFSTMPTASSTNVGQIIQYTGATTSVAPIYTNGYFYKCVAQGTDPETYAWEETRVSEAKEERIGEEITEIGVDYDATRTDSRIIPYIVVDLLDVLTKDGHTLTLDDIAYCKSLYDAGRITQSEYDAVMDAFVIPAFSLATDEQLNSILSSYYDGVLPLSKITASWKVGDTRSIPMSAMSAPSGLWDNYDAQNVTFRIVDMNYYDLATPINGKTKALLALHSDEILGQSDSSKYNAPMETSNTYNSWWENSLRRSWLRDTFYNALPTTMKSLVKQITHPVYEQNRSGTSSPVTLDVIETIFLPTAGEMDSSSIKLPGEIDGRLAYYDTNEKRQKYRYGTEPRGYYLSSCSASDATSRKYYSIGKLSSSIGVMSFGNAYDNATATSVGQAPMFCI